MSAVSTCESSSIRRSHRKRSSRRSAPISVTCALVQHVSSDVLAKHTVARQWIRGAHSSAAPSPMATSRSDSMATLV